MQTHTLINPVRYIICGLTLVAFGIDAAAYTGYWPSGGDLGDV